MFKPSLCSWARLFTLVVPLSIQEYKWVLANCFDKELVEEGVGRVGAGAGEEGCCCMRQKSELTAGFWLY